MVWITVCIGSWCVPVVFSRGGSCGRGKAGVMFLYFLLNVAGLETKTPPCPGRGIGRDIMPGLLMEVLHFIYTTYYIYCSSIYIIYLIYILYLSIYYIAPIYIMGGSYFFILRGRYSFSYNGRSYTGGGHMGGGQFSPATFSRAFLFRKCICSLLILSSLFSALPFPLWIRALRFESPPLAPLRAGNCAPCATLGLHWRGAKKVRGRSDYAPSTNKLLSERSRRTRCARMEPCAHSSRNRWRLRPCHR